MTTKRQAWKASHYRNFLANYHLFFSESGYPYGHKLWKRPWRGWAVAKVKLLIYEIRSIRIEDLIHILKRGR